MIQALKSTDTIPSARRISAWVVPLLALMLLINYVDRGNLATAAPVIKDELHFSGTQIGLLLSAFFWSYTPAQIVAGWLSERINAYRTLALGLTLWSVATIATGFAASFAWLFAFRLLLGLGESAAFPCGAKLLAQHLPPQKLGAANGLILVGLGLGPAFGTLAGGLLIATLGWRNVFFIFGAASLLWLLPWRAETRRAAASAHRTSLGEAPSYWTIIRRREAWGSSLGHFCANYVLYFVISWLPLYLVKSRGLSIAHMAELGGAIYIAYAASMALTGWLSDRWIAAGAGTTFVRKAGAMGGLAIVAFCLVLTAVGGTTLSLAGLFCAAIALGITFPNFYAISQTLPGARAAGKWMGFQNCLANVAGIIAPVITGVLVDRTGQFYWAFLVAGAFALTGLAGWGLMIGEIAPLSWRKGA